MVKESKDCDKYSKACVQNEKETKTLAKCPSKGIRTLKKEHETF